MHECFWSTRLLSETDRVPVWEFRLAPGERIGFRRQVLDYFWTAVTPDRARSRAEDGAIVEAFYSTSERTNASAALTLFLRLLKR
jgi:beta-alanine degradation protein BauB